MISEKHVWKILDDYFKKHGTCGHQKDSFNEFINNGITNIISKEGEIRVVYSNPPMVYRVLFSDSWVGPPSIVDQNRELREILPAEARLRDLDYSSPVYASVSEILEEEGKPVKITRHLRILLGRLPIMLGSDRCNLHKMTAEERIRAGECEYDQGGYFILKGKERVLNCQVRCVYNKILVHEQKAITPSGSGHIGAEIRSMSEETGHSVLVKCLLLEERFLYFQLPYVVKHIPVGLVFKALGFTIEEAIKMCNPGLSGSWIYMNTLRQSACIGEEDGWELYTRETGSQDKSSYQTAVDYWKRRAGQELALIYIGQYVVHQLREEERTKYARQVIDCEIFPHMGVLATPMEKAVLLGSMVKKTLRVALGVREQDNRDDYDNKRVESAGVLCYELFRQMFKKFTKTIQLNLSKKRFPSDTLGMITRQNEITKCFSQCFGTGKWGIRNNSYIRQGVSQILPRLSYGGMHSALRRIQIQTGKESKNSAIREINASQCMFICPVECFDPNTPVLLHRNCPAMAERAELSGCKGQACERRSCLVKDVRVGDILVNELFLETRVRSVINGRAQMYRIKPETGSTIGEHVVTFNHILTVMDRQTGELLDIPLQKYLALVLSLSNTTAEIPTPAGVPGLDLLDANNDDGGSCTGVLSGLDRPSERYLLVQLDLADVKRVITSRFTVKYVGFGPFAGFQLTGSGRFLLEDGTVVHNTPEGQSVGVVLNLALLTQISSRSPTVLVRAIIERTKSLILTRDVKDEFWSNQFVKVFLNGLLLGVTEDPLKFIDQIRFYRTNEILPWSVSAVFNEIDMEVYVAADEGRLVRPVFRVENHVESNREIRTNRENRANEAGSSSSDPSSVSMERSLLAVREEDGCDWDELVRKNKIVYVDVGEANNSVIAFYPHELSQYRNDYCEIFPAMMMGIMGNIIPFPDHSQAPRNCYQCLHPDTEVLMADGSAKAIRLIEVGDEVVSIDPVTCWETTYKVNWSSGVVKTTKPLYEIQTLSGRSLVCTYDHPLLTSIGWVPAIQAVDVAVFVDEETSCDCEIGLYMDMNGNKGKRSRYEAICASIFQTRGHVTFVPILTKKPVTREEDIWVVDISVDGPHQSFVTGERLCVHNSSMGKQAMSVYALNYKQRTDTVAYVLGTPQRPLVNTKPADFMGFNDMPSGVNCIVAIACYTGQNQEDSIIVNRAALDRGLFGNESYKTFSEEERRQGNYEERIGLPPVDKRRHEYNYSLLDERGVIKKRYVCNKEGEGGSRIVQSRPLVWVKEGDVLIGKVGVQIERGKDETYRDCSFAVPKGGEGYVDRVYDLVTPNGYRLVKVVIRKPRSPEVGDKMAARSAQKSTIGLIANPEDMPFSMDTGTTPDLIMNPHAIPSQHSAQGSW